MKSFCLGDKNFAGIFPGTSPICISDPSRAHHTYLGIHSNSRSPHLSQQRCSQQVSHRPVVVLLRPGVITTHTGGHRVAEASEAPGVRIIGKEGVDRIFLVVLRTSCSTLISLL